MDGYNLKTEYRLILAIFLFFSSNWGYSQCCIPIANTTAGIKYTYVLTNGTNASGIAYNPNFNVYYAVIAGNSSYPLETFDASGNPLFQTTTGFDCRGLWWNPNLGQLESNGYNTYGLYKFDINGSGYASGTGSTVFTGQKQPNVQACGDYDYDNNEIIYYGNNSIYRYDRTTNNLIGSYTISGLPVTKSSLDTTSVIYTGCYHYEIGLLDYVNKIVYFIDKSTGSYSGMSTLPSSAITNMAFRFSYANNLAWLYDVSTRTWTSYQILDKAGSIVASTSVIDAVCGQNNGSSTTIPTGGASPYTYLWSDGQTTATASNLVAGIYSVIITDANGCNAFDTISISSSSSATITSSTIDASCSQANGSATATPSGGTSPYTYLWNNGASTSSATNLAAGTYTVIVTDANGCDAYDTITINDAGSVSITSSTVDASCGQANGSATVSTIGGTSPYSYLWSDGALTSSATNLAAGTYTVIVADANGCTAYDTVTINSSEGVTLNSNSVDATCNNADGSATTNAITGVSPFTYLWNNGASTSSATNLVAGTYTVIVTDANGCIAYDTVAVNGSLTYVSADFYFESETYIDNIGMNVNFFETSTNATQYYWDFGDGYSSTLDNPNHTFTDTGTYLITFVSIDQSGCTDTIFNFLKVEATFSFYIPSAFSANTDNLNDLFSPKGNGIKNYEMNIFNRWGNIIYSTTNINSGWDGKINGNNVQEDSYLYKIFVTDYRNKKYEYTGRLVSIK